MLLLLQAGVAVVSIALWYALTTYPVFGHVLLPPFFFSKPLDVASQIVDLVCDRRDLEASLGHAGGGDPGLRARLDRRRCWSVSGLRASRAPLRCSILM